MVKKIEEIYQEILDGTRRSFPKGTWSEDVNGELKRRITRYLIEDVLKWSDEDIKEKWNQNIIKKFKLNSMMQVYRSSPYAMLNAAYPSRFEPWEIKYTPKGFWTKEKSLEILKEIIEEKERLTEYQLLKKYDSNWLTKNKLRGVCSRYFNDSPYQMLNAAYPDRFKEWELKYVPRDFWTKEKSLLALRWWIEEKEKLTTEGLLDVYSGKWLKERNFGTPLLKYWNRNAYQMLNAAYPNQYREWELKRVSNDFWEKEKAKKIIKDEIDKARISVPHLLRMGGRKWMQQNKFGTPFNKYWGGSTFMMLKEIYPEAFEVKNSK